MEISIKWNMCRVCLLVEQKNTKVAASGGSGQMRNLFNEDKKLVLNIHELFGVFMKPGDSLPDKICLQCVSIINNAVQLRRTCRSSNNYLLSVLERTKSASNLFKSEIIKCEESDDEVEDESVEMDSVNIELEHTNLEIEQDNENKNGKKEVSQNIESIGNVENQEKEADHNISDNISHTSMELEEMIEVSEEIEDQMFTQTIEDETVEESPNNRYIKHDNTEITNRDSKNMKMNTSRLQKFYVSASFSKLQNVEDYPNSSKNSDCDILKNDEAGTHDPKEKNGESYHILKEIGNANRDSLQQHEDQLPVSNKDFEFVSVEGDETVKDEIDESLMLHSGEKINDNENQAQVSSTVDTNDEIEYYEHNSDSNIAGDLDEEYLVDPNFSNCDISSSKTSLEETIEANSHTNELETKSAHSSKERKTSSRRKTKRIFVKSAQYAELKLCVCDICGNQFTNRHLMNIHMKVHFREKNHQCELCFKRFITACNLQAHMRIHTGERPFECKYCDRRFNDRSSNLRHERTHTNEKPFECANCGKSFSLATTLQNHMKVHTNERSYRCEPCGKSFKLPHHLKTHQNTSLHRSMAQIAHSEK